MLTARDNARGLGLALSACPADTPPRRRDADAAGPCAVSACWTLSCLPLLSQPMVKRGRQAAHCLEPIVGALARGIRDLCHQPLLASASKVRATVRAGRTTGVAIIHLLHARSGPVPAGDFGTAVSFNAVPPRTPAVPGSFPMGRHSVTAHQTCGRPALEGGAHARLR